jgi:NADH:ubiquinone oxidoreductase subunit C
MTLNLFFNLNNKIRYFPTLILLRTFFAKFIYNFEIVYDFNINKIDIFLDITKVTYFWNLIIILKNSILFNYDQLNDITCIDNLSLLKNNQDNNKSRFSLIYIFTNIKNNSRIIIRLTINKNQRIPSLSNIFYGANWLEREIYDMFVLFFLIILIYVEFLQIMDL